MRAFWKTVAVMAIVLAMAATAVAQEKTDPDEITIGVARIKLSMAYASVRVNDAEWEQSFFENDGLLMILEGMDRSSEYILHLIPMEEEYRFVDLKVSPKNWKLKRLDRQTRQWQFNKKVTFRKWKPGEREEWEVKQAAADAAEEDHQDPVPEPEKKPAGDPDGDPDPKKEPKPAEPEPEVKKPVNTTP